MKGEGRRRELVSLAMATSGKGGAEHGSLGASGCPVEVGREGVKEG